MKRLSPEQAICVHVWVTERCDQTEKLFHRCVKSCNLQIEANPETLLNLMLEYHRIQGQGWRTRAAVRRSWRSLTTLLLDGTTPRPYIPRDFRKPIVQELDRLMRAGHSADDLAWAVGRWQAEVEHRSLSNAYRRVLDDTWRQVIRHMGGDDRELCGPPHDELLQEAQLNERQGE